MSTLVTEWSVLERLLLAQAVNKYGEDNWSQVARTLKHHPLLQDQSKLETFNQKNCSLQYYLMIEDMDSKSPRQVKTTSHLVAQDMPKVVKLARQLYYKRIEDLKTSIKEDESRFLALISEIDDIKSGAMDSKLVTLADGQQQEQPSTIDDDTALSTTNGNMSTDVPGVADTDSPMHGDANGDQSNTATTTQSGEMSSPNNHTSMPPEHSANSSHTAITKDDTSLDASTPTVDSPGTESSYRSATEFNDKMTAESEEQDHIPTATTAIMTEVEPDTVDQPVATETALTDELGTKRRHKGDSSSTTLLDSDQHPIEESSPKRQRLDQFEMERGSSSSPAPFVDSQHDQGSVDNKQSFTSPSDSDIPHPKSNPPDHPSSTAGESTPTSTTAHSPQTDHPFPSSSTTPGATTPISTPTAPDMHPSLLTSDTAGSGDKSEADGSESATGSDSNAATPSEKRRSVSTGSSAAIKDDARQKSWQKNVTHLWREIANHKNGAMFMNPIKENQAPLYYNVVKHPLDLKSIKNRVRDGVIRTTLEFERDVVLMLTNSLMYNKEGTEIYQMALEMLQDVTEQIKIFKSADSNGSTHTRSTSLLSKDRRKSIAE